MGETELEGTAGFDVLEVGFLGKYYMFMPMENLFIGLGGEAGAAFLERVEARAEGTDCEMDCSYVFPAAVEIYGRGILDVAYGARDTGGFHLTINPTLYSSHASERANFMIPVMLGFEF